MDEGIRLDQALFQRGLVESRKEAQECIEKGHAICNGVVTYKPHKLVQEKDELAVTQRRKYVSRGGEKLEGVLHAVYGDDALIRQHLEGKLGLDVGASTGGFTDCLLAYGVSYVDAVDVGTSQLHPSLKNNIYVHSVENTDIRSFESELRYGIIVADVSFISLHHVLPSIISHASEGTEIFLLVKPQFEVGKEFLKKGIVKDLDKSREVVETVEELVKSTDAREVLSFPCVIEGGDGNQEYFIYARF